MLRFKAFNFSLLTAASVVIVNPLKTGISSGAERATVTATESRLGSCVGVDTVSDKNGAVTVTF
jgi:hypothetical protein